MLGEKPTSQDDSIVHATELLHFSGRAQAHYAADVVARDQRFPSLRNRDWMDHAWPDARREVGKAVRD